MEPPLSLHYLIKSVAAPGIVNIQVIRKHLAVGIDGVHRLVGEVKQILAKW